MKRLGSKLQEKLTDLKVEFIAATLRGLAKVELQRHPRCIIVITGSVGKTTTKALVSSVLAQAHRTRATDGNTNDRTGVPSTILNEPNIVTIKSLARCLPRVLARIFSRDPREEYLALEIGAKRPGQIAKHFRAFKPDIAIVTTVGASHLETLGTVDDVAHEKSKVITYLSRGGIAVLCADDQRVSDMAHLHEGKTLLFGFNVKADVQTINFQRGKSGLIAFIEDGVGTHELHLPSIHNRHHLYSVMAAWCIGMAAGVPQEQMAKALTSAAPRPGRGSITTGSSGTLVYDDSFNANPVSLSAALDTLKVIASGRRRVAILGDMLELGRLSLDLHREMGMYAARCSDVLITVGEFAEAYREGFTAVEQAATCIICKDLDHLTSTLNVELQCGDVILFKGSHGTGLFNVARDIKIRIDDW